MSKTVTIYCEGQAGSHDYDLLVKVLDGLPYQIQPIGGKTGAKSAIQVYEKGVVKSDMKLFFRDRDFDQPLPATECLTIDDYVCFSYKTTLENYLISLPTLIAFLHKQGTSLTGKEIEDAFLAAAQSIQHHQAVRHVLGKLRMPVGFKANIVEKSGQLPTNLDRNYCRTEGIRVMLEGKQPTTRWTEAVFDEELAHFEGVFAMPAFYQQSLFLDWFQGKDLAKALSKAFSGLSMDRYYEFAKDRFDYTQFADLVELRQLVERAL
jgi:hypothetical protein